MNAVFRKNLTDALAFDANQVDTAFDTSGALGDGRDRARFCRTAATRIWGVSDPLPTGPGTRSGGWQRGSLTPQMPPSLLPTIAPTATRAANSAARLSVAKLLIAKNIASSPIDAITLLSRLIYSEARTSKRGPLLPRLWSPLLFFAFVASAVSRGREPACESAIVGRLLRFSREG